MDPGEAIVEIERYGTELAGSLLEGVDPLDGGVRGAGCWGIDAAAHQFLWRYYMVMGWPACGEAVLASLQAICRSARIDQAGDGAFHDRTAGPRCGKSLGQNAQWLELLTWVWRQCRCPELRHCAEGIATWALQRMRVPGFGFAAGSRDDHRDDTVRADGNGLMLVALVEAGSVLERRDWLTDAREVFEEIVACLSDGAGLRHFVDDEGMGKAGRLDDYAMMIRAAIRLFEAFGKRRYIDFSEAWIARLDDAFWESTDGGYRICSSEASPRGGILDDALPSGNALMIGVLARLHALTNQPQHAARAEALVAAFHDVILRSGLAGATAIAAVQTLSRPVSIKVSGDPTPEMTRELMRIALDYALPDRLVLGPGAGDRADASPKALVRFGTRWLAPVADAARLRAFTAPGGLQGAH